MSVSLSIGIVPIDESNNGKDIFLASVASDQLAFMMLDWANNAYVSHAHVLNETERTILKATYSTSSQSVMEGLEKFHPNIVAIEELLPVMIKVRQQYLLSRLKEEVARQDQYEISKLLRDIMAISECIGVLELLQKSTRHVYVAIVDG